MIIHSETNKEKRLSKGYSWRSSDSDLIKSIEWLTGPMGRPMEDLAPHKRIGNLATEPIYRCQVWLWYFC